MEELKWCLTGKYSLIGQVWNEGLFVSRGRGTDVHYLAKKLSLLGVPVPKTISYGYILTPLKENGNINKGKHNRSKFSI